MYDARSREDGQFQDLEEHLRETAGKAAQFAAVFGAEVWGWEVGVYHDIGKTSRESQARIHGQGPPADHSTIGAQLLIKRRNPIGAYCVAGHHGRLPDGGSELDPGSMPTLSGRVKRKVPNYDPRLAEALRGPKPLTAPFPLQTDREKAGLRWALFTRMLASCLVDADRLDAATFDARGVLQGLPFDEMDTLYERLTAHLEKFRQAPPDPNPRRRELNRVRGEIQAECLARAAEPPGLFTLTVPTGGGKTLASLAFALAHIRAHAKTYGLRRVFYMLPYTSIIEQNADVYRKLLGAANVLEHHSNARPLSKPDADGTDPDDSRLVAWQRAAENWDAPLIVTTNVQFFESLFSAHSSRLRKLHNLARSVLILDEAQMIPQDSLRPCVAVLSELVQSYGCTVVLMSATQPALQPFFGSLRPKELISDPTALHRALRRTHIETLGELEEADLAERLCGHGQVLCIVNSRRRAQALFQALPKEGAFHLSTLMYPNHRRAVLARIQKRLDAGMPCRIVSTSLIEAGVDLSVPVVYREEAGLDSILQAAGRCNREAKATWEESPVYVFRLAERHWDAAQEQAVFSAHGVLEQFEDPGSPEAVEAYFCQVYNLRRELLDAKRILELTAEGVERLSIPFRKIEEAFRLINDRKIDVVVARYPAAKNLVQQIKTLGPSRERMRVLGAYTAQVDQRHLNELIAVGAVRLLGEESWVMEQPWVLVQPLQYDPRMGLKLEVETGLSLFQ